jgi:hypothetical protein
MAGGRLGEPVPQGSQAEARRAVQVGAREAAVGEVLLFFSVEVGITRTARGSAN